MIAIYSRSAAKNNESIAQQVQKCLSLINGQEVVFFSDNGTSGLESDREGLKALIESGKTGLIKKVLAVDPARFSRNFIEVKDVEMQLNGKRQTQ
ncbi:recombinase family protein, partial [Brevibacillus sp. NRS-1366]|uniref:recombinase family protein n=1 Tax=Brevibacillus sp. NRS-1366 TaxID=3233899 RepID=UPI003D2600EF